MKTLADLRKLLAQRTWDKEVILWIGSSSSLRDRLRDLNPAIDVATLDLLDLLAEHEIPDEDDEIARAIRARLRPRLSELRPTGSTRRILVVQSAALLHRYGVGLKDLFDWYVGDHAIAALVLDGVPSPKRIFPPEVSVRAQGLVDYFNQPDLAKNVFTAA